jgi:hypothetical protein
VKAIRVAAGKASFEIELEDTPTSRAILAALPFESRAQTWGEEVYFSTPVGAKLEAGAKQVVEPGTACFWCEGDSIALPYGPTPISTDGKPKLANRCNLIGRVKGDPRALAAVRAGDKITVTVAPASPTVAPAKAGAQG